MGFVGNLPGCPAVNFENPLRIAKVIAMCLVYYVFETLCIHTQSTSVDELSLYRKVASMK